MKGIICTGPLGITVVSRYGSILVGRYCRMESTGESVALRVEAVGRLSRWKWIKARPQAAETSTVHKVPPTDRTSGWPIVVL